MSAPCPRRAPLRAAASRPSNDEEEFSKNQLKEIKNGRLAQIAFGGTLQHRLLTGKGPIEIIAQIPNFKSCVANAAALPGAKVASLPLFGSTLDELYFKHATSQNDFSRAFRNLDRARLATPPLLRGSAIRVAAPAHSAPLSPGLSIRVGRGRIPPRLGLGPLCPRLPRI